MSANKRTRIMFGLIVALAGWYAWSQFGGPEQVSADESDHEEEVEAAPDEATANPGVPESVRREQWTWVAAAWPENPFVPPIAKEHFVGEPTAAPAAAVQIPHGVVAPGPYVLNAIVQGEFPLAMINQTIVAVGDELADGDRVIAITELTVTVAGPSGRRVLELSQ